jgi:hypothetical protein
MNISYNYEVIESSKLGMVLRYTSEGRDSIDLGTHSPTLGESVDNIAAQYSPVNFWLNQEAERVVVPVGTIGSFVPQILPPPTPEQILTQFVDAIQNRLDTFAQTRNYDGILSAASYATSGFASFATEGQYALMARDSTWAAAYQILAEVQAETRSMPSSPEEVFPELPALVWPT